MKKNHIDKHLRAVALMAEYRKAANCMLSENYNTAKEAEAASTKFLSTKLRKKIDSLLKSEFNENELKKWNLFKPIDYKSRLKLESTVLSKLSKIKNNGKLFNDDFIKIEKLGSNIFLRQFEAQAEYYPEKPAIRYKDTCLTYKEANDYSNQIAHCLIEKYKIKKGDIVGVFLPHDEKWIPSILAIWKIGAAFVAIDSKIPTGSVKSKFAYMEKFNHLLEDVDNIDGHPFKCVISTAQDQSRIPKNNLCLDDDAEEISQQLTTNIPDIDIDPNDLSYIMYTSGSSGRPKGVLLNHKGLSLCLEAHRKCVDITSKDIMAQYAAISFDAWLAEMLVLGVGAQLVIVPSEYRLDLDKLIDHYNDTEINICILTPAVLKHLQGPEVFPKLKALFVVGEKFTVELAKKWITKYLQVINGYGLVETHIAATLENLNLDELKKLITYLSIGKAIIGTDIHILKYDEDKDQHLKFVKNKKDKNRTEKGELFISGVSLADKYTKFSDKENTKRFKYLDPKSGELHNDEKENTIRVYRTGDKGYFINDIDRRIVVTGRYGRVVKFSGKRVNLDGLEVKVKTALKKFPIRNIAIELVEDKNEKTLVVFYILNDSQKKHPDNKDIKDTIENNLGDRANDEKVKAILYPRSDFHPTPNGKKDYKTLKQYYLNIKSDIIPQQHESTSILDKCWRDITGTQEKIQPFDSFRDHGGSSLSTMLLLNKLRSKYPKIAPYLTTLLLLEHTTFQKQQQLITNLSNPIEMHALPTNKRDTNKLGDEKYTVFCIHSIIGDPILDYDKFSGYFPKEFQLIGIKARGHVDINSMPQTIDSIATDYCVAILQYRLTYGMKGPVTIIGHSSGGNIAIEIARQLKNQSEPVPAMPFLIDSTSPALYQKLSKDELCNELIIHGKLLYRTIKLPRHKKPFSLTVDNLRKKQTMKEKIDHLFDTLDSHCGDTPDNKKMLQTARRIRLAEQIYVPQSALPPYYLYVAEKQDLSDCTPLNKKTLDWPKHNRRNPEQSIFDTNHLGIVSKELAKILKNDIKSEYRTYKVPTVEQIQTNNITPLAKIRLKKDMFFEHGPSSTYVIPRVVNLTNKDMNNKSTYLTSQLIDFLKNPKLSVLLIQAESGMGKTSSTNIIRTILKQHKIPSRFKHLSKKSAKEWRTALKSKLNKWKWDKDSPEICVLILDAYNEMSTYHDIAIYRDNKLRKWKNLKVIITCGSEHLSKIEKSSFHPKDNTAFQEIKILPYNQQQQHEIIIDFIAHQESYPLSTNECIERITANQSLSTLSENLMLLRFILSALPKIASSNKEKITTYELIKIITNDYFDRSAKKLAESKSGLSNVKEFKLECKQLCQDVAIAFWMDGNRYFYKNPSRNAAKILKKLLSKENHKYIEASPIHYSQSEENDFSEMKYRFQHGIFQEFFATQGVIRILLHPEYSPQEVLAQLNKLGITSPQRLPCNSAVNVMWEQAIRHNSDSRKILYEYIYLSRKDETIKDLSAISITILNMAKSNFCGADFSNIRIPNAVLSQNLYHYTNFSGADLSNVQFVQSFLSNTNFNNAILSGAIFSVVAPLKFDERVTSCAYSSDSKTLALGFFDGSIQIWSVADRTCIRKFSGHKNTQDQDEKPAVSSISFSNDMEFLVTTSYDGSIQKWNIENGKSEQKLSSPLWIHNAYFSPSLLYVAADDKIDGLQIWNLKTNQGVTPKTTDISTVFLCFLSDENSVALTSKNTIYIYDLTNNKLLNTLSGQECRYFTGEYLPNSENQFIASCDDFKLRIWDTHTGECLNIINCGEEEKINYIKNLPENNQLITKSEEGLIRIWDLHSCECIKEYQTTLNKLWKPSFSPNGQQIAFVQHNKEVKIININENNSMHPYNGYVDVIKCVTYSKSCNLIATGAKDSSIRIWDPKTGGCLYTLLGHSSYVLSVLFLNNDKFLASGSSDGTIRIWDLHKKKCIKRSLQRNMPLGFSMTASPDSKYLVFAQVHTEIKILDSNDGKCIRTINLETIKKRSFKVNSLSFSPDGKYLASSVANIAFLFDTDKNYNAICLKGHSDYVFCTAFSANGKYIATGSKDKSIKVWDLSTSKCICTLNGHQHTVKAIAFANGDKQIISGSFDKTIKFWNMGPNPECTYTLRNFDSPIRTISVNTKDQSLVVGTDNGLRHYKSEPKHNRYILSWMSSRHFHASECEIDDATIISKSNELLFQ